MSRFEDIKESPKFAAIYGQGWTDICLVSRDTGETTHLSEVEAVTLMRQIAALLQISVEIKQREAQYLQIDMEKAAESARIEMCPQTQLADYFRRKTNKLKQGTKV